MQVVLDSNGALIAYGEVQYAYDAAGPVNIVGGTFEELLQVAFDMDGCGDREPEGSVGRTRLWTGAASLRRAVAKSCAPSMRLVYGIDEDGANLTKGERS